MNSIRYIQHKPFLAYFTGLLESRDYTNEIKALEVGCGPGHFSALLKDQLKDRIDITAIDPSQEDIQTCASHHAAVKYRATTILDMDPERYREHFDVILFSKSLHHCDPLDETVEQAHRFLKKGGILVAEEFNPDAIDEPTARFFFNRLDLLRIGNHILQPAIKSESFLARWEQMIDPKSGPPVERWASIFNRKAATNLFKHGLQGHHMSSHGAMITSLAKAFGSGDESVVKAARNQPFLQCNFVLFGLEDTPIGEAVVEAIIAQEASAIKDGVINGTGVSYLVEKQ
ncbi:S-adenosyl-L-methionine-dependent methyltransferase [Zychaea mexicana]|uniref:S-adenosyl-L-methionine-dependent methyltransferase n=1 Tax=Zychaea mexicana TaxID=64656 RepID=UPI0022FEF568|nr:S-adenosyl-L-methionine-dependent methyltransferase [Zychaea mexicana]KAI9495627.1 S-adenosyl-L-methionine-dependent methyltransferase [Zychaea mexicana]